MNRERSRAPMGARRPLIDNAASTETPVGLSFRARSVSYRNSGIVNAPPEAIFPLLCPVREYEWIEGWSCEVVYTMSGVAEEGCIFKTSFPDPLNPMTWVCSRYEPSRNIQYVGMVPGEVIMRLNIDLELDGTLTKLSWSRSYTGLSDSGNKRTEYWKPEWDAGLTEKIEYYLKNGTMLRGAGRIPGRE